MINDEEQERYLPECRTCSNRVQESDEDQCEECRTIEQNAHNAGAFLAGLQARQQRGR